MTESNILWGALAIGREANILDKDGNVELPKVFRLLELGRLPARKNGRLWVSTKEAIRSAFEIKATT